MGSAHGEKNPPEACGQQEQGKDAQYEGLYPGESFTPQHNVGILIA
jgi:hypothetical protein